MDEIEGDAMNSLAGYHYSESPSMRGLDEQSSGWQPEGPGWDDLDHDSRDLLSVLSAVLSSGLSSDARLGS
jgi:hypothetical protein